MVAAAVFSFPSNYTNNTILNAQHGSWDVPSNQKIGYRYLSCSTGCFEVMSIFSDGLPLPLALLQLPHNRHPALYCSCLRPCHLLRAGSCSLLLMMGATPSAMSLSFRAS